MRATLRFVGQSPVWSLLSKAELPSDCWKKNRHSEPSAEPREFFHLVFIISRLNRDFICRLYYCYCAAEAKNKAKPFS